MGLAWVLEQAQSTALNRQEWHQHVVQYIHLYAGWIKVLRTPLQLADAQKRRWVKRPGYLDLWPFNLERGLLVTCNVGYICANFGLPMPLWSRVRPDVHYKQTNVRQKNSLMPPYIRKMETRRKGKFQRREPCTPRSIKYHRPINGRPDIQTVNWSWGTFTQVGYFTRNLPAIISGSRTPCI